MKLFFSIQNEKYLLAAFFLLPAIVSCYIFSKAGLLHGKYLLFSLYLVFSGLLSLTLSLSQIRYHKWGRWLSRSVPTICFMAAIYWISSFPYTPGTRIFLPDYIYHTLEFAVLGYLALRTLTLYRSQDLSISSIILALLLCLVYAASDELHQRNVPGRHSSLKDLLCDTGGIAMGMMLYVWIALGAKEKEQRREAKENQGQT